jgi:AcrR family transcriptional regulator
MSGQRAEAPATPDESPPDGVFSVEGRSWRRRAGRTRRRRSEQAILSSARPLFEARSYEEVTVEMIAAAAGVSPGTVYNCFGSKAAIAAHLLTGWLPPLEAGARQDIAADLPLSEAVSRHFERLGMLIDADRTLAEALFLAVIEQSRRSKATAGENDPRAIMPLPRPLYSLLEAGKSRGELWPCQDLNDLSRIATAFLATRVLARTEPATLSGAFIADLLLNGIRADGPATRGSSPKPQPPPRSASTNRRSQAPDRPWHVASGESPSTFSTSMWHPSRRRLRPM